MGFFDEFEKNDELDFWIDSMEMEEEYLRKKKEEEDMFEESDREYDDDLDGGSFDDCDF